MFQLKKCCLSVFSYSIFPLFFLCISSLAIAEKCQISDEIKSVSGELGYQKRGQLCEGLYESKISADFELVSLSQGGMPTFEANSVLTLSTPPSDSALFPEGINITALSVKPRLYYRMDALIKQDSALKWALSKVVSKIPLMREDIGIFGWKKDRNVLLHIPIIIQPKEQAQVASPNIQIAVRTGVNVEFLIWRVFAADYTSEENIIDTYHPAGRPIGFEFVVPKTTQSIYKIQIDAKAEADDDWITQTLFIARPTN